MNRFIVIIYDKFFSHPTLIAFKISINKKNSAVNYERYLRIFLFSPEIFNHSLVFEICLEAKSILNSTLSRKYAFTYGNVFSFTKIFR